MAEGLGCKLECVVFFLQTDMERKFKWMNCGCLSSFLLVPVTYFMCELKDIYEQDISNMTSRFPTVALEVQWARYGVNI